MRNKDFISCFIVVLLGIVLCSAKHVSSLADNAEYRSVCTKAASNPEAFTHLKRSGIYTLLHEYTTQEEGSLYAAYTIEHYPELLQHLERFRRNDLLCDPVLYTYPFFGDMSASTVRFIKLAGDISRHVGSLDGKDVVEIGGGYGGLCTILSALYTWKSYTIIDTQENLEIAKIYLDKLGIQGVHFAGFDAIATHADVVLSDHGFGQCHRTVQERLLRHLVKPGTTGYVLCGSYPRHFRIRPLSKQELLKKIRRDKLRCDLLVEEPEVAKDNFILTWK